ncbi:IS5 family transposase [Azospirillum sp. 11R-A]|uniref:IS5 family transposase n=1 Tax=Azospirillum sp. 11R-A TaxID=3111634 RepID=UPI003C14483D
MGTAVRPASTTPASWDAFSDVEAFVEEVLIELTAMAADGSRPTRSGPKPELTGAVLRKAIMAIWCVAFCGMQWRAIGQLSAIPFGTLYALFARWTRLGLWRRLLGRLRRTWRLACGDVAEPSAVVIDSRSCPSAPSCFARGVDGGKKIRGIKIQLAVEKYNLPLAIDASPANVHDTKGIVPVLRQLAEQGFQGPAIGDLGYRGNRLAKVGDGLGITIQPIARGRNGVFIPTEIAWVVERSFSWLSRYRRLNTIVERTKEHLVAFVEIAFISILSRRLQRLAPKQVNA